MQVALQRLGNGIIPVGYEIGSHEHTNKCGFHNQTMTFTLLYELQ
jgi:hypothetical protein